jgi:hypothetical protein
MRPSRLYPSVHLSVIAVAAFVAFAASAAFNISAAQSAQQPTGAATGQTIGGISCDAQEGARIHIHQHLVIFDHGQQVSIPPNVGQPAARPCIYWLHTHTPDGVIHIEAPQDRSFVLGDFFNVWGQPLSRTRAASARAARGQALEVWVNGERYTGDPRAIKLDAHTDIVIEAGPPFVKPPRFTTWNGL